VPSFTSQIPNLKQIGPICTVKIGVSSVASDILSAKGEKIHQPVEVSALIDTGASGTCITPEIVKSLNLIPRGATQIATPSTKAHPCDVYDVSLLLPNGVAIPTIQVIETPLEGQNIQCLIGRDVLAHGTLNSTSATPTRLVCPSNQLA